MEASDAAHQKIGEVSSNLSGKIDGVSTSLNQKIDGVTTDLNGKIGAVSTETSQKIADVNSRVDANASDINNLYSENDVQDGRLDDVEYTNNVQNNRLDDVEYTNNVQNNRLDDVEYTNNVQNNRLDDVEYTNNVQNNRLDDVEYTNNVQNNRLDDVEYTNNVQNNRLTAHDNEFATLESVLGSGYNNPNFNALTAQSLTMGGHTITATNDGFNMGGARLSGIADGGIYRGSTDAVTGNQLWNAYQRMDDLQESINVVGAHAAALSGLHPIDYNPYEPTTLSAAIGTYRDEYAVAVGVFHYAKENVMFNLGASLCSDGDVMGRAGVSFTVGKSSDKPKTPKNMNEVQAQLAQVQQALADLKAENEALKARLDEKD